MSMIRSESAPSSARSIRTRSTAPRIRHPLRGTAEKWLGDDDRLAGCEGGDLRQQAFVLRRSLLGRPVLGEVDDGVSAGNRRVDALSRTPRRIG